MRGRRESRNSAPQGRRESRNAMQIGDRILVDKGIAKRVYTIARVEIPHSNEKVFASKSGGAFTIGIKVWKSDYVWSEKSRMWVAKNR
jgi:hypothetical protein